MLIYSLFNIIFKFLVFFVIFIFIGYIVSLILLRKEKNKKKLSNTKIKIYGLFLQLNNKSIFALSVVLLKYILIIYLLFNRTDLNIIHLYILLLFSIIYIIIEKGIKTIISELVSSVALYYSLFFSKLLTGYTNEIRLEWYVILGNTLLILFIFMYSTYFLVKNVDEIVSKNRPTKQKRSGKNGKKEKQINK